MSVARNTAYNFLGAIAPIVVTIVTTPIYLRVIGVDRYGLLAICWTFNGLVGFLSLGMGPALTQRLAAGHALPADLQSRLFWTALVPVLAMSALGVLVVLAGSSFYFARFAQIPSAFQSEVRAAIPWIAASLPLGFLMGPLIGALQAKGRFLLQNMIQVAVGLAVPLVSLAVAILVGPTLWHLIAATVAVQFAAVAVYFAACARILPVRLPIAVDRAELRTMTRFGGWMTVVQFLAPIVLGLDRLIIGTLRGPAAVAAYVLPYQLVQRLVLLPGSFTSAMFPRLSAATPADEAALQDKSIDSLAAILTPMAIAGMAILGPFLTLWVGRDLAAQATVPGVILALGFWVHGVGHVPSTVLMGRGTPAPIAWLLLIGAGPYLLAVYFLTGEFGITGAATAWLLRVLFDPMLFWLTKPRRAPLLRLAAAAALVACAAIIAIRYQMNQPLVWLINAALTAGGLLLYREFWTAQTVRRLFRLPLPAPAEPMYD